MNVTSTPPASEVRQGNSDVAASCNSASCSIDMIQLSRNELACPGSAWVVLPRQCVSNGLGFVNGIKSSPVVFNLYFEDMLHNLHKIVLLDSASV